jgi:hypothetical protein
LFFLVSVETTGQDEGAAVPGAVFFFFCMLIIIEVAA